MFKEVRVGYPRNLRSVVKISVIPAHVCVFSVKDIEQLRNIPRLKSEFREAKPFFVNLCP